MYSSKPTRSKTPLRETAEESWHVGMQERLAGIPNEPPLVAEEHKVPAITTASMLVLACVVLVLALVLHGCANIRHFNGW